MPAQRGLFLAHHVANVAHFWGYVANVARVFWGPMLPMLLYA
jgi:hypothetical protein